MMKLIKTEYKARFIRAFGVWWLLVCLLLSALTLPAQAPEPSTGTDLAVSADRPGTLPAAEDDQQFRVEKVPIAGGAEIITLFARHGNYGGPTKTSVEEMPLISVLRDTLGDDKPENDQLRYVWMLTYTKPTMAQKAAAFVPFLYMRTSNKNNVGTNPPPAVYDMKGGGSFLNTLLWQVFKRVVLKYAGAPIRASILQYHRNIGDYKKTAIAEALTVMSFYQMVSGEKFLSDSELKDIQGRLFMTDVQFGGVQTDNLHRAFDRQLLTSRDIRGHNWDILRQFSEGEDLIFEPLEMPDGTARHAILWAAEEDIAKNQGRPYTGRFLSIKNPWSDPRLKNWKGYKQVRWYTEDDREVEAGTPGARQKTLIPLAVYGLDHPKVPIILIDFRDHGNPKRREMSERILNDVTTNVLALSQFKSLPYFFGRYIYGFVTGRRSMDLNQPSRMRAYAQLKTLLELNATLDVGFRDEIADKLESVSLNPLENDSDVEAKLPREQYKNLMDYAKRADGLPAQLQRERVDEMDKLAHTGKQQMMYTLAHLLTFGLYTHKGVATPELQAKMDMRRQLGFHERVLRETARYSARPEVDTNVTTVKNALTFVTANGQDAGAKSINAVAKIFTMTRSDDLRDLCVAALYKIDNPLAKTALLTIYNDPKYGQRWRDLSAQYLKRALGEGQRIAKLDAVKIAGIVVASGN